MIERLRERGRRDRGAALVEYALAVSLFCVVAISSISFLQTEAKDELTTRGNTIGNPAAPGVTTPTTVVTPPTTTDPTTPPSTGLYTGTVTGSCTGPTKDARTCSFTLSPAPPTPAIWSIQPNSGFTGSAESPVFTSAGTRSVRATVTGYPDFQRSVTCVDESSNRLDCTVAS